jgi:anti-sigma B factor antagonist
MGAVEVRKLSRIETRLDEIAFLRGIEGMMNINRPRLVLECSSMGECGSAVIRLLLHCLEEAMKRNGDVKLARVPAATAAALQATGVARLFEMFDSTTEAVNSFHRLPQAAERPSNAVSPAEPEAA